MPIEFQIPIIGLGVLSFFGVLFFLSKSSKYDKLLFCYEINVCPSHLKFHTCFHLILGSVRHRNLFQAAFDEHGLYLRPTLFGALIRFSRRRMAVIPWTHFYFCDDFLFIRLKNGYLNINFDGMAHGEYHNKIMRLMDKTHFFGTHAGELPLYANHSKLEKNAIAKLPL
jgi:hypothetical protein